ncbi:coiled-coil domain-containing protein 18 isoform X2 [Tripterygium wilfordii]|uniref:Coiled-coil domain-containing protein 18 isoform X2 n=1 Tax=Tripterygium wilfordii TaxID=458696 RepID=A0A7J7CT27_TRIWF|nr:coiled-coil domain-containing protein 18 isoform X2 [Tripterygium wilfordii]
MSWLRTAVNRAVEVGGNNNITRTVRNYADSVVVHAGNAVTEGAKIIQDRIGARNLQSFRLTVKRLEDLSVSCRGTERLQLLRRWLVALKEVDRLSPGSPEEYYISGDSKDSPRKPTLVYYIDPDIRGEPMNFRDVFLHSQALEGMALSLILEAPNDEEILLLQEIFGLCLSGDKEVHIAVISSIQDMATAFSNYEDEVLAKREELLQYAQVAIAGLKINADLGRIDAEACSLMEKVSKMKAHQQHSNEVQENSSVGNVEIEDLKDALGQIKLYSKLEALLLKKKYLSNGDSPKLHAQKADKLKVLSESLVNLALKAEERVLDHRHQKEEALNYRVAKANEVCELEKEFSGEIKELEKQKDDLEAELKKVNTSLTAARARLRNAREERDQFDEASNQILMHLKMKTTYSEQKEKQVKGELERYGDHFVHLVMHFLSGYKEELAPFVARVRKLVENLCSSQGSGVAESIDETSKSINPRKNLEQEYLDIEAKFVTTLSIVDAMKKHFYAENEGVYRKDDDKVRGLFDALEKIKEEFESIDRPTLEVETPTNKSNSTRSNEPHLSLSPTSKQSPGGTPDSRDGAKWKHTSGKLGKVVDIQGEMEKLASDLEKDGRDSTEEIGEWEFDELAEPKTTI